MWEKPGGSLRDKGRGLAFLGSKKINTVNLPVIKTSLMAQILITTTTCLFSITISAIHGVTDRNTIINKES